MNETGSSGSSAGRLSRAIREAASQKNLFGSLILWLIFLVFINGKPFGIARLQEITGGPTILDMTFTTGPDHVYAVLDALGEAGRVFDLTHIVPLDLVFPFTYALFLSLAISWALSRLVPADSPLLLMNLVPVIAAVADYCENAGIITLLLVYPSRLDIVAWFTSIMYIIKFAFSALSFFILLAALAVGAFIYIRRSSGRSPV